MGGSRTPSPSRTRNNLDTWEKLAAFEVHVDTGHQLPSELETHIKDIIQKPRDADVEASPNAKKITQRRRLAAQQNERTGIKHIEPYMLFRGVADLDERVEPVPYIASKDEVFLNKFFRPRPPNDGVKSTFGELSQPRPDSCIGYVTRRDAQAAASQAPFSVDEEQTLQGFPLTQFLHFPFLTSQWKAQIANENMLHARYQAARDGAVVVNYLREFYKNSDIEPSIIRTCHFSLTCDLEMAEIWIHWHENKQHHMELINKSSLRQLSEVEGTRNVLRNIVEYSLDERLTEIKKAIPSFATQWAQGSVPAITEADRTASASSVPSLSDFQFAFPITPSSLGSSSVTSAQSVVYEPAKKRRLNSSADASGK
ncbi:hypothetical protein BS50DRAFT_345239 [Corynespora cassiicola Philippines]|uniref:DUF7924 domain-containing protein n=1 Tax=Corynespora cassiicola Philippines TaxID=1448308 RepID=A0A2T2N0C0_CORCC|nr:hypothetical protein BS50DRAFT_345239 [Corynespora cassiicola Philippines]